MNLPELYYTYDQGNSHPHVGVFHREELKSVLEEETFLRSQAKLAPVLVSKVGEESLAFADWQAPVIEPKDHWKDDYFFDLHSQYSKTLGDDRLYQIYYVYSLYHKTWKDFALLIDAGTFITLDIIRPDGHAGGWIFPGLQSFCSLYEAGAQLPHLDAANLSIKSESHIPKSTSKAMSQAACWYLQSQLQLISQKLGTPDQVILTGGASLPIKSLAKEQFPQSRHLDFPHLIHHSLSHIYGKILEREKIQ